MCLRKTNGDTARNMCSVAKKQKPGCERINIYAICSILPSFETQQLVKIDAIIINKAFDLLKNRLSDKTVSDIRCVFKSIWKFGIKNYYPCCDFQFPKSRIKTTHKIYVIPPDTRRKMEHALLK